MKRASHFQHRWLLGSVLALIALVAAFVWIQPAEQPAGPRELPRSDLDLREGRLYVRGETQPFQGRLIDSYSDGTRKLIIDVFDGQLHGRSQGWYPSGKVEVEEQFIAGVSHGPRTRWHANGNRKSAALIEHGKVVGPFTEWHENGQKAVAMTLRDGQPDGLVEAWHPSGALKSRIKFENGKQVEKEFWKDTAVAAN